jgi:hypothetical protein
MTPPTWPELIVLMCFGESEEQPFTGVVTVDDPIAGDDGDGPDGDPPLPTTVRVHKKGARYRVETLDGDVLHIRGTDRSFVFRPGSQTPAMTDWSDDDAFGSGTYGQAVARPRPTSWRGDDFTTPTGPPTRTTFLGRDAWHVELAPPPHKPAPVQLVVDAVTGMQLRWGSDRFGDVFRWISLETGVELDDSLFEWDGPFVFGWFGQGDDLPEDVREDIERSEREKAELAATIGVPALTMELGCVPQVLSVDSDGAYHALYDFEAFVTVRRRPRSDEHWELDGPDDETTRWVDDTWDWAVRLPGRSGDPGRSDRLARLRQQLAEPRRDDR